MILFYEAVQRERRHARADLIEDILAGRVDSEKALRSTQKHIKALRKH